MTYDTKNKILHTGIYERIKLTKSEHKLLVCLSSNNMTNYEEMQKYLDTSKENLSVLKTRLEQKTNYELKINTMNSKGYRLESEIYFK